MQLTDNKICSQIYLQLYLRYTGCKFLWVGIVRNMTVFFTYLVFIFVSIIEMFILGALSVFTLSILLAVYTKNGFSVILTLQCFELLTLRNTLILKIGARLRYFYIYSLALFVVLLMLVSSPVINGVC